MRKILLSGFISVFIFCSCNKKKSDIHISGYFPLNKIVNLDSLDRPMDSTALYFPPYENETLSDNYELKSHDSAMAMLASKDLYNFKEPILSSKYLGKRMYRIFYIGESEPKSIRLIKEDDGVDVVIKYSVFESHFEPVKLGKEFHFSIKPEYWDTLSILAKRARMWNVLPTVRVGISYLGLFIEGHSEYGYTHLGKARIEEGINAEETGELRKYFERIEGMK